ncbi:MAG: MBOAT family O-acyltransferase, partial [Elusimicrobiota bacterium]
SITTDYFCGLRIHGSDNEKARKRFLLLSILVNLSILGFFKYFNFFADNFAHLINHFGFSCPPRALHILLPLGISFYTLKTISYTVDVYLEKIKPTRSYRDYALFVSFFPLILAGPIMRAGDLLRQISSRRKVTLEGFQEGSYLIFWGAFQKFFVADNLALIADKVFNAPPPYSGAAALLAVYAYAFQIYCDFAGYSNIARGLGRCMGFDIMVNFNLPYFATNPQDFWQRWHISLSAWLRDYIYTPIAVGLRGWKTWGIAVALMATFLACGLWHGAAWTFVIWGAYWGLLLTLYALIKPLLRKMSEPPTAFRRKICFAATVFFFFNLTCLGWLIFRAQSVSQAYHMIYAVLFNLHMPQVSALRAVFAALWLLIIIEGLQFAKKDALVIFKWHWLLRGLAYFIIFMLMSDLGASKEFIYGQF